MDRPTPKLTEEDMKILAQAGMGPLQVMGAGSSDKYGSGAGGRASYSKRLAKDLNLEAYLEGHASKRKGSSAKGEITGGGLRVTKQFKKGGAVSASKRADGCAVRGKTKGRMV
jgi:hypothetical protein